MTEHDYWTRVEPLVEFDRFEWESRDRLATTGICFGKVERSSLKQRGICLHSIPANKICPITDLNTYLTIATQTKSLPVQKHPRMDSSSHNPSNHGNQTNPTPTRNSPAFIKITLLSSDLNFVVYRGR